VEEDPRTEELRVIQSERETAERARADAAAEPEEQDAHARRAAKAAYLREKLEERAAAEREGDEHAG
jgi:hypothetical protein